MGDGLPLQLSNSTNSPLQRFLLGHTHRRIHSIFTKTASNRSNGCHHCWTVGCKILTLDYGYNKRVPPISHPSQEDDSMTPVLVKLSSKLLKVVAIKEGDNSIEFQFQITLEWKENRASFQNLKTTLFLNDLSLEDISKLRLPLVIYINTDKQETTQFRSGMGMDNGCLLKDLFQICRQ